MQRRGLQGQFPTEPPTEVVIALPIIFQDATFAFPLRFTGTTIPMFALDGSATAPIHFRRSVRF